MEKNSPKKDNAKNHLSKPARQTQGLGLGLDSHRTFEMGGEAPHKKRTGASAQDWAEPG